EVEASLRYHRVLKNEKVPPRKKLYIINDALLLNHKKMLMNKDISLDTYVKYTMEIFDLSRLSKKKNKSSQVLDDSDSDLSDHTSSNDSELLEDN
ncbi:unnamed protein product, partial [Brachionus calyciflorus]